jgi:CRISPR-associated protein (TIGR02584 family)
MEGLRNILVAVVGLTPQVVTETLYYLTQVRDPPAAIAEIHVLTTQPGRQRLLADLLAPHTGRFYAFCAEYDLDPAAIAFDAERIYVLCDAAGVPLDDIRTAADSSAVADQILACVRRLTADPATRLYCSLAGGRKTQSVLLGFALQLYGRPQDELLHVLVPEELEGHPEFFYPTRTPRLIRTRDGRTFDISAARVEVAAIPYVRLREKLFADQPAPAGGFQPTVEQAQHTLDALPDLPPLVIEPATRRLRIGATTVLLTPLEIVLYAQFALARRQRQGEDGFLSLDELDALRGTMLQRYRQLYGEHSGHVEALQRLWREGIPPDRLRSHLSNLKRKVKRKLGDRPQTSYYVVTSKGPYGATRYGLQLPAELIELRDKP